MNQPAALVSVAAGRSANLSAIRPGCYIWHAGAFRLVRSRSGSTVRMAGGFVLRSTHASTVEVPAGGVAVREVMAFRRAARA